MKLNSYILKSMLFAAIVFSCQFITTSCADFLNENMYSQIPSTIITDSKESAQWLTNGALSTINQGDFFQYGAYQRVAEYDTDYMESGDWALKGIGAGNFLYQDDAEYVHRWWEGRYALIYRCNKAIKLISDMKNVEINEKNNMLGQLHFLKGWAYYQLVIAYGPVPIHEELTDNAKEYHRPRKSVEEVFNYSIKCLNDAADLLYAKSNPAYKKGRLSKYAAKTLLAEIYTTMGSGSLPAGTEIYVSGGRPTKTENGQEIRIWQPTLILHKKEAVAGYNFDSKECYKKVVELCKEIIESNEFALSLTFKDLWSLANRNGSEFIWQLQASMEISYLRNDYGFSFSGCMSNPPILREPLFRMRQHWYELFEDNINKIDDRAKDGVWHRWGAYYNGEGELAEAYFPRKDSTRVRLPNNPDVNIHGYKGTEYPASGTWAGVKKFYETSDISITSTDCHYPFLRYATVYLMYAEAANELDDRATAIEMVDVVRRRAKATLTEAYRPNLNKVELRSFILEERARELAFEGYRRWDLLRWGVYLGVMNAVGQDGAIKKFRERRNLLLPIPPTELQINKAITENNPGWNY